MNSLMEGLSSLQTSINPKTLHIFKRTETKQEWCCVGMLWANIIFIREFVRLLKSGDVW